MNALWIYRHHKRGNRIVSIIGELASFVAAAKASTLPEAERERLRLHLTDTVVAALAGTRIPEGRALGSFGEEASLAERIGRRAASVRLTEIDDIHLPSCTTPSAGVVPVALMLAAATQNFDPQEIASAIWVGAEVMTRLGVAVAGPQILYRGIWPTYLAAPAAAAAAAARMLGLNEARTGHALSLAVMLAAGGVGRIHGAPSGRWFLYANAVAGGVAASVAARADYCGDPALLDKNWLADTHGVALDRAPLLDGLGARSVFPALSIKPICSAKQAIAAVEAFRYLVHEGNLHPEAIAKIRVRVPPAYAGMIATRAEPGVRQSTLLSVAHQIALAAIVPRKLYDVDRSSPIADAGVAELSAKVEVVPDRALEQFYPQHWPAEVELEAAGKTLRRRVVTAAGDPEYPVSSADIDEKAHRVLDPLLGAGHVDEWLTMCHGAFDGAAQCRRLALAFADGAAAGRGEE
jgi:2-methylcitrate dehydratase PrpD